ncbi:MAG TPA: hypothetical protein VHK24_01620 [Steroidobacter sp.]|jgi:hypothetical protein|nr:hypothetical protein [Steroidobacter sp.]
MAQAHVALGQFAEAVDAYSTLQSDFGHEFAPENFTADANFAKFVASPQFKDWLGRSD